MGDQIVGLDFVDDVTNSFAMWTKSIWNQNQICESSHADFYIKHGFEDKTNQNPEGGTQRGIQSHKKGGDMAHDVVKIFKSNKY